MLGKGGFAHVYRAYHIASGKEVGIKMVIIFSLIMKLYLLLYCHWQIGETDKDVQLKMHCILVEKV